MKYSEYLEISSLLHSLDDVDPVHAKYPYINKNTLISIFSLKNQLRNKKRSEDMKKNTQTLLSQYEEGESIVNLAKRDNYSPCLLMRVIVSSLYEKQYTDKKYSTAQITKRLLNPQLFITEDNNKRLYDEITACINIDPANSPHLSSVRLKIGQEYENKLYDELIAADIPYRTEDELKEEGAAKTPDVLLILPIAINNLTNNPNNNNSSYFLANWIDSKATFGDFHSLKKYSSQFTSYVNRYGNGIVIFWFDYIEDWYEINRNNGKNTLNFPGILFLNAFPQEKDIIQIMTKQEKLQYKAIMEKYRENNNKNNNNNSDNNNSHRNNNGNNNSDEGNTITAATSIDNNNNINTNGNVANNHNNNNNGDNNNSNSNNNNNGNINTITAATSTDNSNNYTVWYYSFTQIPIYRYHYCSYY